MLMGSVAYNTWSHMVVQLRDKLNHIPTYTYTVHYIFSCLTFFLPVCLCVFVLYSQTVCKIMNSPKPKIYNIVNCGCLWDMLVWEECQF